MDTPQLKSILLDSFKTFIGQRYDLAPLSIIIGRNSSGKSNLFDAIDTLRRLAVQPALVEALDARHAESRPVRGGSRGLPPFAGHTFSLGCEVLTRGTTLRYEIEVSVEGHLRVTGESLWRSNGGDDSEMVFEAVSNHSASGGLSVTVPNGETGQPHTYTCRDSATALGQVVSLLDLDADIHHVVRRDVDAVREASGAVFALDPIPHLMRGYVNERDSVLRRHGENISAVLAKLKQNDRNGFARLVEAVNKVADGNVVDIGLAKSTPLNDVMATLVENYTARGATTMTPANQMSDGLLRFLAVAIAMIDSRADDATFDHHSWQVTVIEEIENGLHPSQASLVLDLVHNATLTAPHQHVIMSTHSPALLTACEGGLLGNVVVCQRSNETGLSELRKLVELPGYPAAMARGSAGDMMIDEALDASPTGNVEEFLARLGDD